MSEGRRPRGVTPHPRTGAAAKSARPQWCRNDREELPHVRVLGGRPRGAIPHPRPGVAAGRSHPVPEARGGGQEEPHHIQEAVAMQVQEGLEELSHVEGQEGWR